jgi:hypothetical protein
MDRLKQWLTMGIALLILGIILHFSHGKSIIRENHTPSDHYYLSLIWMILVKYSI